MAAQKRKKKRQKYIPAYAVMYIIIFIIVALFIVIFYNCAGCGGNNSEQNPGVDITEAEITTTPSITTTDTSEPTTADVTSNAANKPVNNEDDWALYVIGNDNPLPDDFTVETKTIAGERQLDVRCADYAIKMLNDAAEQKVGLYVTSAYRSIQKQAENMESYINTLMTQGYTKEQATEQAHKEIALPGHSEHNAGLAMDIVSDNYWSTHEDLEESFDQLPQYDWLIENSWKYGFILSYPKGKEDITGFIYEPWHYRFVGLEHAETIHKVYEETGEFLTVNEYIEKYIEQ